MTRPPLVMIAALLAALSAGWWMSHPARSLTGVVVITMDTTRADRLTPYGLMDASMPALERLAHEGVIFDRALSVAPLTLPAHASLFTGLYPSAHGVGDNSAAALAGGHATLAEVLRERGFRTGAFVGSVVLNADRGLAQGFETYRGVQRAEERHERTLQRRADDVITDAMAWLDRAGQSRFFLWAHLYDPHRPYDPPEPYRSRYADQYVAEIAFADAQIGRLLDYLRRRGLLDRTVVVVAGDHGESLGEHGERDHGIFVYESVLRVPLIVRVPGQAHARVGSVVRLVDVMPTVLDFHGIPARSVDGISLRHLITGAATDLDLEAYAESIYPLRLGWSPLRTIRERRYKFIDAPRPELYDLLTDPFEERNLYEERRSVAEGMSRRLQTVVAAGARARSSMPDTPDGGLSETKQRIWALGYVGTPYSAALNDRASLPDPKDCIHLTSLIPVLAEERQSGSRTARATACP